MSTTPKDLEQTQDGGPFFEVAEIYSEPLEGLARTVWALATRHHEGVLAPEAKAGPDDLPARPAVWGLGGHYAAHILRLHGRRLAAERDDAPAWTEIVARHPAALSRSGRLEDALALALELRRAPGGPDGTRGTIGRDLIGWLTAAEDDARRAPQATRLVRHVHNLPDAGREHYAGAWWATHGPRVAERLSLADAAGRAGRAWSEDDRALRQAQAAVALGMWSAGAWTKASIARSVGVSRPTLDAWIERGQ
ncbi:hypothetical protein DNL40_02240 [Xylanimonas oleitrophica]|uniref:Uncharacterized protein n=1 Tax=Xylanimonas oleitrophica TaxID=2607479 RepID=A0A2W5WVM0_9MICO|nr:hypothetical protein [Xylanimonas oleitrophica]PZR55210.1 hypothetical protein DNL40_02240 [Xylanimonas oleitrophica]